MDGVVEVEKARLLTELDKVHQFGITTDLWSYDSTGHDYDWPMSPLHIVSSDKTGAVH